MIQFMKTWCEGIIVALMISMIIELILPEGNHKKYVKVVIGIYILFVILNPVLGKVHNGIEIPNIFPQNEIVEPTSANLNDSIKNVYIDGVKENIKKDIEEMGYTVYDIEIKVDKAYENIEEIVIQLGNNQQIYIEPITIGKEETEKVEPDVYLELKNSLAEKYATSAQNIHIIQK